MALPCTHPPPHGAPPPITASQANQRSCRRLQGPRRHRLGCYFCPDVVAPLNSTADRALDQQCTVARPGLAPMAGALAVELLAALSQHPEGARAPAGSGAGGGASSGGGALGPVPHMVRAQLAGFSQVRRARGRARQPWTLA